jgi:hypothetical protein
MPRRLSLRELFSRIVRGLSALSDESLMELANEAADLFDQRCQRLQDRERINIEPWGDTLRRSPEQLKDLVTHNDFLQLIRARDVDIVYHLGTGEDNLFLRPTLSLSKSIRSKGRIIFQNSLANQAKSGGAIVESWSRMYSMTRDQNKHLWNSLGQGSKYFQGIDFEKIEGALFQKGIGLLTTANCMFLYGRCEEDIGTDFRTGLPTQYVCMQCDRFGRALVNGGRNGYKTQVHSYPIATADILRGIRNSSGFRTHVSRSPEISI